MPIPLEVRKRFISRHLVDDRNRKIRLEQWAIDNVLTPIDGFKLWHSKWEPEGGLPARAPKLCRKCTRAAGQILRDPLDAKAVLKKHAKCCGLALWKIMTVAINLKRQQGKSTFGAAYALSELFLARNVRIIYIASAEKQAKRVFQEKFLAPIYANPKLKKRVQILGTSVTNAAKGNVIQYIPASAKSVPGGTSNLVIIDEARDVSAEVAAALLPQILGARGLDCPFGHYTTSAVDDEGTDLVGVQCPTCAALLEEWVGRVLVMSSSGDDSGWFAELVAMLEETPSPMSHLFRTAETLNPNFNVKGAAALEHTFGALPSMATLLRRELRNEFTRQGDEYLRKEAILAVQNPKLSAKEVGSDLRCVGFLDASRTNDLTSLYIVGDPWSGVGSRKTPEGFGPWTALITLRIDVWDPKDKRQCPNGRVDYNAIFRFLEEIIPKFPRLTQLGVDTAVISDAKELVDKCRRQPWGRIVRPYQVDRLMRQELWDVLERRVLAGRQFIQIPKGSDKKTIAGRLYGELKAATIRKLAGGKVEVMDSAQGNRKAGLHRDIAMSLAGCCWLVDREIHKLGKDEGTAAAARINASVTLGHMKPVTSGIRNLEF